MGMTSKSVSGDHDCVQSITLYLWTWDFSVVSHIETSNQEKAISPGSSLCETMAK